MKKFLLLQKTLKLALPILLLTTLTSSVYGACTWDDSRKAIEMTDIDSRFKGSGKEVLYEIEASLTNLLKVTDQNDFTFGSSDGETQFKSSYKTGKIIFNDDDIQYLPLPLEDGKYKADIPDRTLAGLVLIEGYDINLDLWPGPCGPQYNIRAGEYFTMPLRGFNIRDAKTFTVGKGSKEISSSDLKIIEGGRKLQVDLPHRDIISSFNYEIRAVSVQGAQTGITGSNTDGPPYYKSGTTSNGIINISDLAPTTETDDKGEVQYQLLIYFGCGVIDSGLCTFQGGNALFFKKDQVTTPMSDNQLRNQSNNSVEACRGDLTCVNCVVRKPDGSKFASYQEAATVVYETGSFKYTNYIYTAIGCVDTSQQGVVVRMIQIGLGISGGVILFRIGVAVTMLQSGNPAEIKEGQEIMTASIVALLIIVFAGLGLRFLGVNVFGLLSPGTIETV
jgi:hypothetical protein